jgi:hypothetical protein
MNTQAIVIGGVNAAVALRRAGVKATSGGARAPS